MKLIATFLLLPTLALAQTAAKPKPATAAAKPAGATASAAGCVKEPPINPRIPAPPAGSPCAKHLYTISTMPNVRVENISPLEGPGLAERLDIKPTSFSLDYIEIKTGAGELAAPHMYYTVNYTGYLPDGSVLDSSAIQGGPYTFLYGDHRVVEGWDTGLNGMHLGGKRRLIIPWQLAYGTQGRAPKVPPRADLVFDIELISQSDKPPAPPTPKPAATTNPPLRLTIPPATSSTQPAAAPATPPAAAPATPPAAAPTPSPTTPPKPQQPQP